MITQYTEQSVVLVSGSTVHVINRDTGESSRIDLATAGEESPHELERKDEGQDKKPQFLEISAVHLAEHSDICLVGTACKRIYVFKGEASRAGWILNSIKACPRKSVKLLLAGKDKHLKIITADRAGDVHELALAEREEKPQGAVLLMGRLSMLLDMVLTPDGNHLIVSDRDEKIQVSRYPKCFDIVSFCLGSEEFVTSIICLDGFGTTLASVGGDGHLRLWDYLEGRALAHQDLWTVANSVKELQPMTQYDVVDGDHSFHAPLKKVVQSGNYLCISYSDVPFVHVVRFDGSELSQLGGISLESPPIDIGPHGGSRLLVLGSKLAVYDLTGEGKYEQIASSDLICAPVIDGILDTYARGVGQQGGEIPGLYKQWFDNVEEYQQRKKKRITGLQ